MDRLKDKSVVEILVVSFSLLLLSLFFIYAGDPFVILIGSDIDDAAVKDKFIIYVGITLLSVSLSLFFLSILVNLSDRFWFIYDKFSRRFWRDE
tara:strand:- start:163 stop:444 length:282 start_codon:yes stop_codon:yes gene_type:complete